MPKKVLIVEDDGNIAELLHLYLEKEGFETQVAQDGGKGVELFRSFQPDLVLLDIMLPVMDGWSVLKKIREGDKTPVIMLTAKGETEDKVTGLEQGADDYIVKPFEMKEVLARIHAVLRRTAGEEEQASKKLTFDKLVINLDSYELLVDGQRIDTPPTELELLYHLASAPNLSLIHICKGPRFEPGPLPCVCCKGEGEMGGTSCLGTGISYRRNMAILCIAGEFFVNIPPVFPIKLAAKGPGF